MVRAIVVAEVRERPADPCVTPLWILDRHPDHERGNFAVASSAGLDRRRALPSYVWAISLRYQRRIVSSVTMPATCIKTRRPSFWPRTARRRRWASVRRSGRGYPGAARRTRFSSRRDAIRSSWGRRDASPAHGRGRVSSAAVLAARHPETSGTTLETHRASPRTAACDWPNEIRHSRSVQGSTTSHHAIGAGRCEARGWHSAYFSQPIFEPDRSLFSPTPSPLVPRQRAQSANSLCPSCERRVTLHSGDMGNTFSFCGRERCPGRSVMLWMTRRLRFIASAAFSTYGKVVGALHESERHVA